MKLLTELESGEYIANVLKLKGTLTILIGLIGSSRSEDTTSHRCGLSVKP